ncbi:MAG: flagellar basal body P-ring formation protein FlgA [Gammaproteobacteria bacterium]|nr:flagellar basal body P-ring formation protein FlgA [Gammaproteobacteria bacterium]MBT7307282.1 flagellar basal body P-ring formation protein FlgA [Gammaproteobacteria bacterium]
MRPVKLLTIKGRFVRGATPWRGGILLFFGLLVPAFAADREGLHSLQEIYSEVEFFLLQDQGEEDVTVAVTPLDSRLRLKQCAQPLTKRVQRGRSRSGKMVVEVRCQGEKPWRVYLSALIRKMEVVLVTAAPIPKGEKIGRDDLLFEERDLSRLRHGHFTTMAQLEGQVARRAIQQAVVLTPKMVYTPNLVNKGDQVSIQSRFHGLKVQMRGVAMENGQRNGRVQVKNHSSGKVVEGVVVAPGRVVVE